MLMDVHIIKKRDKGPGSESFVGTLQYADGTLIIQGVGEGPGRVRPGGCPGGEWLQFGVPSAQTWSSHTLCSPPPTKGHPIACSLKAFGSRNAILV